MRAISLTLTTVVLIIMLLITLVTLLVFFRGGFSSTEGGIESLSSDIKESTDIDLDPELIFCPRKEFICEDSVGTQLGDIYTTDSHTDPWAACNEFAETNGCTCKCKR